MRQRLRVMMQAKAGSKAGRVATGILMAFSFLVLGGMWSVACYFLFGALAAGGNAELGLFGVNVMAMLMTLFFSIASVIGTLFSATDSELLMSMPLRQGSVFAAKFVYVYAGELLITAFIALPAYVCYMIAVGFNVWTAAAALLVVALLPALPMVLASLASLLLMRSAVFMRHREAFMTAFSVVIAVGFSLGGQLLGQMMGRLDENELMAVLGGASDILSLAARSFPPAAWAARAVSTGAGYLAAAANLGLWLLLCGAAIAVAVWLGARTYFKGAAAMKESAKSKPEKARLNKEKLVRGSALMACCRRESRSVLRSATYAANCLLGVVMFPLMLLIVPLITSVSAGAEMLVPEGVSTMQIYDFLLAGAPGGVVFAAVFTLMIFTTFANMAASTAISREGVAFAQVKAMPLRMSVLVYGKLIFSAVTNALTVALTAAVLIVLMPSFAGYILFACVAACIACAGTAALGMLVDVLRPKLVWQNEAEAVKQNVNGVFGMLLDIAVAAVLGVPSILLGVFVGAWAAVLFAVAGSAAVSALSVWGLGKVADRALAKV